MQLLNQCSGTSWIRSDLALSWNLIRIGNTVRIPFLSEVDKNYHFLVFYTDTVLIPSDAYVSELPYLVLAFRTK
jgi:hypothetical protein